MLPPKGPEVAVEMCCRPGGATATHPIMGRSGSVTSCKRLRAGTGSPAGARSGDWSLIVPASTSMSQNERSASSANRGSSSNSITLAASADELKPQARVMRTLSSVTTSVSPGSAPATANGPD